MPHPVHICPLIVVVSNHHAHCTSVRDSGSGPAHGLQQSCFTPTLDFCCKLWVAAAKVIIPCCLIPIYVNNCQSVYHGCSPVRLLVQPVPNVCWHIGLGHQGYSSCSNHVKPQFFQVINLWGSCTGVLKVDLHFCTVFPICHLL